MKTKLLSKLMMVAAVVMWLDSENKCMAQVPLDRCVVCNENDVHQITLQDAATMISAFHNKIISQGKILNIGGCISFNGAPIISQNGITQIYTAFKLHWAVADTTIGQTTFQRLYITSEDNQSSCINNRYSGNFGVESQNLNASFPVNDILAWNANITPTEVEAKLDNDVFRVVNDSYKQTSLARARIDLANFKAHSDLFGMYQCDDVVFNKRLSYDQITQISHKNNLMYFFGYDETQTYHRLRIIFAGTDENNNLILVSAGQTLLRENSRPRP